MTDLDHPTQPAGSVLGRPPAATVHPRRTPDVQLLRNPVRPYAWGSRTIIAELLGNEVPAPHPEAELWIGAHPADPSQLLSADGARRSLLEALDADPVAQLGAGCVDRWGPRLPFMVKLLAAEEPLSLQAHPSARHAAEGYAREEAAGIPRDAPNRDYPDPMPKPELLCALSEFHALIGFRDVHRSVRLLTALDVPGLRPYTGLLAEAPDADGLRALFSTWVSLPQPMLDTLVPEVLEACVAQVRERGEFDPECRTVLELGEAYPGDAGVLCALLLNRVTLAPGEAIFLPAGNVHAYLRGTGLEVLGNSDNVLRCGLTPKHVNVPELLRILDFTAGQLPVLRAQPSGPQLYRYAADAAEFELTTLHWEPGETSGVALEAAGGQILICTAGAVWLHRQDGFAKRLGRGESCWVPAAAPGTRIAPEPDEPGPVTVFRATAGML